MHSQMEEQMNQQDGYSPQSAAPKHEPKKRSGDYIDFEEVK